MAHHKLVNGVKVPLTDAEIEEFELRSLIREEEKATTLYRDQRASEYPSLEDQLDLIYHNGLDAWKAVIASVKAKYPKPE